MRRSGTGLGIDIDGGEARIVMLKRHAGSCEVMRAVRLTPSDGDMATALHHFFYEADILPSRVVCSLPNAACALKSAEIPRAGKADIARMVRYEAEARLPLPLEEMSWGYRCGSAGQAKMEQCLIAGVRSSVAEDVVSVMEAAYLEIDGLAFAMEAALRCMVINGMVAEGPCVLLDIGREWTSIGIADRGELLSCRCSRLAGDALTAALAEDLGVSLEEAEDIKLREGICPSGGEGGGREASAAARWLSGVAAEVRRSLLAQASAAGQIASPDMLIFGSNAALPGLISSLAEAAGMKADLADPWSGMETGAISLPAEISPSSLAVATGLALLSLDGGGYINLIPVHELEDRIKNRRDLTALSAAAAALLVMLLLLLAGNGPLQARRAGLQEARLQLQERRAELKASGVASAPQVQALRQTVTDINHRERGPLEMLRLLSLTLPEGVWLSELSFEKDKALVIKGNGQTNLAVASVAGELADKGIFSSVTLDYTEKKGKEDGSGYDFRLTCSWAESKKTSRAGSGTAPASRTGVRVQ